MKRIPNGKPSASTLPATADARQTASSRLASRFGSHSKFIFFLDRIGDELIQVTSLTAFRAEVAVFEITEQPAAGVAHGFVRTGVVALPERLHFHELMLLPVVLVLANVADGQVRMPEHRVAFEN